MASRQEFSELDLEFMRSLRRSRARRIVLRRRSPLAWRSVRAMAIAFVLLAFVAESTRVETSKANARGRTATAVTPSLGAGCPVPVAFRAAFAAASARTGVPASVLVATAYEESHMNPHAQSGAGARALELALAAYNAGPSAVERSGGAPTFATLRYVKNIELRASQLTGC